MGAWCSTRSLSSNALPRSCRARACTSSPTTGCSRRQRRCGTAWCHRHRTRRSRKRRKWPSLLPPRRPAHIRHQPSLPPPPASPPPTSAIATRGPSCAVASSTSTCSSANAVVSGASSPPSSLPNRSEGSSCTPVCQPIRPRSLRPGRHPGSPCPGNDLHSTASVTAPHDSSRRVRVALRPRPPTPARSPCPRASTPTIPTLPTLPRQRKAPGWSKTRSLFHLLLDEQGRARAAGRGQAVAGGGVGRGAARPRPRGLTAAVCGRVHGIDACARTPHSDAASPSTGR